MNNMRLTSDPHHFWQFWSVRLSLLAGIISGTALGIIGAYALRSLDWQPELHRGFKLAVAEGDLASAGAISLLVAVSRFFGQPKLSNDDADPDPLRPYVGLIRASVWVASVGAVLVMGARLGSDFIWGISGESGRARPGESGWGPILESA